MNGRRGERGGRGAPQSDRGLPIIGKRNWNGFISLLAVLWVLGRAPPVHSLFLSSSSSSSSSSFSSPPADRTSSIHLERSREPTHRGRRLMLSDDAMTTMETAWSVDSTTERHVHAQKGVATYWQQCKSMSGVSMSDTQACMDDDDLHYETEMYGYHHVYMRRRSLRNSEVSGLPLICSNCGISFFSLRSNADDMDAYCSGECKWSVIMYREMDRRMYSYRSAQTASSSYSTSNSLDSECGPSNSYHGAEDVISCH